MSISSTRKVSSSTASMSRGSAVKHAEKNYTVPSDSDAFVEMIDTSNNISINNNERDDRGKNRRSYEQQEQEPERQQLSNQTTYIPSAIEALSASGVYDEEEKRPSSGKVNVYGNNQSIIKDEEIERTGRNYLKHFYEKNEFIEEVDELV